MKTHSLGQKGFGAVESLLIVVIVAIVAFTGFYVVHAKNASNKNLKSTPGSSLTGTTKVKADTTPAITLSAKPYTDSSTGLQLYYPAGWTPKTVAGTVVTFVEPTPDKTSNGTPYAANVNVVVAQTTLSQDAYVTAAEAEVAKLPSYHALASQSITSKDGTKIDVLQGTFVQDGITLHNYQGIAVGANAVAVVTTTALDTTWSHYQPAFLQIMTK